MALHSGDACAGPGILPGIFLMKIHEFQAKKIFAGYGIPVPQGEVADTPERAGEIARQLNGAVVVKAQIHAGGRGRGGGVKL
ncbi:MAG: ATP-grasp domain-containing protein, partial [Bacteroidales bacterium]